MEWEKGGGFVEEILEAALEREGISGADRGLIRQLVLGIVRWRCALDWLISTKVERRPAKAGVRELLRLGAYQLFWLNRVPDHAAVHETVSLAGAGPLKASGGFVNAVLRRLAEDKEALWGRLVGLQSESPATGWSHPDWLVRRWKHHWGAERLHALLEWNNTPAPIFARVNRLRATEAGLLERWAAEGVEAAPVLQREDCGVSVLRLDEHPPLASLGSFREGWFYIQDPSTVGAVAALNPGAGETVLDLCSAPGGKATLLAELMRNEGEIVAADISESRLVRVRENCERLGVRCLQTRLIDEGRWPVLEGRQFDRVLVDAPCSNTGVMRRRVDLRWRIRESEIGRLAATQLGLLSRAAKLLRPGGVMVHSTCSIEPEENRGVVYRFLEVNPEFRLDADENVFPFTHRTDGGYWARLVREVK